MAYFPDTISGEIVLITPSGSCVDEELSETMRADVLDERREIRGSCPLADTCGAMALESFTRDRVSGASILRLGVTCAEQECPHLSAKA